MRVSVLSRAGFLLTLASFWKVYLLGVVVLCLAYPARLDTPAVLIYAGLAAEYIPICDLQGSGESSAYAGQEVRSAGIVYADLEQLSRRGFFLQAENCDGNPNTSDGMFVYLGDNVDIISTGDYVEVTGIVQEYKGLTEILANEGGVEILSWGNSLPEPLDLNPPLDYQQASGYLETLEGMYVRMENTSVVGPTDDNDQTWVVNAELGIERIFHDDPVGSVAIVCVSGDGVFEITPEAKAGDHVLGLLGALDYSGQDYRMLLLQPPVVVAGDLSQDNKVNPLNHGFSIATFNLANLFDTYDDPSVEDSVLSPTEYQRRLQKRAMTIHETLIEPDILVVQEVENLEVIQALMNQPVIEADYGVVWQDSPDQRGLDIALLYRQDRIIFLEYQSRQGCTGLADGLGPDGNGDVLNPENVLTCDRDGGGILDGNRLFSRPPLVVRLRIVSYNHLDSDNQQPVDLTVIVNHWKSKTEDTPNTQYTLPRRIQQAQFVATLAQEEHQGLVENYLVVAGDFNDTPGSQPLSILGETGLRDLTSQVVDSGRYTYIYRGISQELDYILDYPTPRYGAASVQIPHINADFPAVFSSVDNTVYRSSDHDPFWVNFVSFSQLVFFPQVHLAR